MSEIEELRAEVERLRQGLWDAWVALGHDPDGDSGPGAWIAGSGVDSFIATVVKDAAAFRQQAEEDYDADTDALTARAESAEAALASEREAHAGLRARLEALAGEWEQNAYRCTKAGDCPVCVTYQGVVIGLRRVLAAEPAAPVAAEEGGAR